MAMSYKKLWKQLIDRDMTRGDLHQVSGVALSTFTKMSNGECVATTVIERICKALNCDVGDIMEVVTDKKTEGGIGMITPAMKTRSTMKMSSRLTRRDFGKGAIAAATAVVAAMPTIAVTERKEAEGLRPLIKYRGGKSKELAQYLKFIPKDYATYYEPFVGGGATFFALMPQCAVIGDINEPLINFYRDVRNRFDGLQRELAEIQAIYERNQQDYSVRKKLHPEDRIPNANEGLYYRLRDQYNGIATAQYSRAALYFFINKTAYSGMIRYNAQGHFNVPFGRYEHFNTKLVTREHSQLLQRTEVLCADYEVSFKMAGQNDFMYLDPPYDCVFNDYGNQELANGFDEKEHRRLAKHFRELKCRALMVIGHTPLTEELYGDLVKAEYAKDYAVNIRNRFHSQATHYVVTNYEV